MVTHLSLLSPPANTLNDFGWARNNDCKILHFRKLALARGARGAQKAIFNVRLQPKSYVRLKPRLAGSIWKSLEGSLAYWNWIDTNWVRFEPSE
jgi:hypothetical protein